MSQTKNIDIIPSNAITRVHVSQGDIGRTIYFNLYEGSLAYIPTSGDIITCVGTKPSGLGFTVNCTWSGNVVTCVTTEAMTDESGFIDSELVITSSDETTVLGTSNFVLVVEKNPHPDTTTDGNMETLIPELTLLVNEVKGYAEEIEDTYHAYGSPWVASTVSAMTDTTKIYVYTGSETGYTSGNWYYYNGTSWVSGGVYNSVAVQTDTTLSVSGMAADAKAVGGTIVQYQTRCIECESGTFKDEDGVTKKSNSYRIRNVYPISVTDIYSITIPDGYQAWIFRLDKSKTLISAYGSWQSGTLYASSFATSETAYLNIAFKNTSTPSSDISSEVDTVADGFVLTTTVSVRVDALEESMDSLYNKASLSTSTNGYNYLTYAIEAGRTYCVSNDLGKLANFNTANGTTTVETIGDISTGSFTIFTASSNATNLKVYVLSGSNGTFTIEAIDTSHYIAEELSENVGKRDLTFESGAIISGEEVSSSIYARTGFFWLNEDDVLYLEPSSATVVYTVYQYDENCDYTSTSTTYSVSTALKTHTSTANGYYRLRVQYSDASTISDLTDFIAQVYPSSVSQDFVDNIANKVYRETNYLPSSWTEEFTDIQLAQGTNFCFAVQADTHFGSDVHSYNYMRNMKEMTKYIGFDFITNLGDVIRGYASNTYEATQADLTEAVHRYVDGVCCPVIISIGNHDDGCLYTQSSEGSGNASLDEVLLPSEQYAKIFMPTSNTCFGNYVTNGKSLYYYVDFDDVRVINLNTRDLAYEEVSTSDVGINHHAVSSTQLTWLTDTALNTDKHVVILCHVPLLASLSDYAPDNASSVIDALTNFINNGGSVVGVFCGHMHTQSSEKSDGINHITFANGGSIVEIVIVDTTNRTITTKIVGSTNLSDRTFTY